VTGFGLGLPSGLVSWLAGGLTFGLTFGLVVGLVTGFGSTCWGRFAIVRVWLAVRGRLPLRLVAFLDDAHRRGVLRQAGAIYQFRHARLQDHLADTSPTSQPTADLYQGPSGTCSSLAHPGMWGTRQLGKARWRVERREAPIDCRVGVARRGEGGISGWLADATVCTVCRQVDCRRAVTTIVRMFHHHSACHQQRVQVVPPPSVSWSTTTRCVQQPGLPAPLETRPLRTHYFAPDARA
jgi:hypothetical protein